MTDSANKTQWDVVCAFAAAASALVMLVCFFAGAVGPGLGFLVLAAFFLWRSENTR